MFRSLTKYVLNIKAVQGCCVKIKNEQDHAQDKDIIIINNANNIDNIDKNNTVPCFPLHKKFDEYDRYGPYLSETYHVNKVTEFEKRMESIAIAIDSDGYDSFRFWCVPM